MSEPMFSEESDDSSEFMCYSQKEVMRDRNNSEKNFDNLLVNKIDIYSHEAITPSETKNWENQDKENLEPSTSLGQSEVFPISHQVILSNVTVEKDGKVGDFVGPEPKKSAAQKPHCSKCDKSFRDSFLLQRHLKRKKGCGPTITKCPICGYNDKTNIRRHIRTCERRNAITATERDITMKKVKKNNQARQRIIPQHDVKEKAGMSNPPERSPMFDVIPICADDYSSEKFNETKLDNGIAEGPRHDEVNQSGPTVSTSVNTKPPNYMYSVGKVCPICNSNFATTNSLTRHLNNINTTCKDAITFPSSAALT